MAMEPKRAKPILTYMRVKAYIFNLLERKNQKSWKFRDTNSRAINEYARIPAKNETNCW